MNKLCTILVVWTSLLILSPVIGYCEQISIKNGNLVIPVGGGIEFPGGKVLSNPDGITGPMGPMGPEGPQGPAGPEGTATIVSGGNGFGPVVLGAGATNTLASIDLQLLGGKNILILSTISPLTWQPAPQTYGGKNHSLHINVEWRILANGNQIGSIQQTAEQNIIQIQMGDGPTTPGPVTISLQAVNGSFWSLDDSPFGQTAIGSNNFGVILSAMEL